MIDFSGVLTALVTPFRDGKIDERSLRRLVRRQLDAGIRGFVVGGTTGESPTLSSDERRFLFESVRLESGGSVPILLGTGSNDTRVAIARTREAEALKADGALIVTPYYNKPPQRGLVAHFKAIAENSSIPIVLYNVPGRTAIGMDAATIGELSRVGGIVGVKEATGDISFGKETMAACRERFLVTSGDDLTFLELALAGGGGVISVASHILPEAFVGLFARAQKGDRSALAEFSGWRSLIEFIYCESNPIPVKTALWQMGVIDSAELRLPLVSLAQPLVVEMRDRLERAGLLA